MLQALECTEECILNDLVQIFFFSFSSDFIAFTGKYEITTLSIDVYRNEIMCLIFNGCIAFYVQEGKCFSP